MGNSNNSSHNFNHDNNNNKSSSNLNKEYTNNIKSTNSNSMDNSHPKILCLHGSRTSGSILSMQTAAFRANVNIKCEFPDAPFTAEGPPDSGIATFYPDRPYYEWVLRRTNPTSGNNNNNLDVDDDCISAEGMFRTGFFYYEGLEKSIDLIIDYLINNGPFDGILGFSQGAAMTTRIAYLQENNDSRFNNKKLFNFVILIGGVVPHDVTINMTKKISIPSLHLHGEKDIYLKDSQSLSENLFENEKKKVIVYNEGHNIPSIRTNIYPEVKDWVYSQTIMSK